MDPLLIFLGIVAIVICAGIAIWKSNRYDALKIDVDILRRRNETLEERFEKEDASKELYDVSAKAYDFLQYMGRKNHFDVEEVDHNEDWITSVFTYQGGHFTCATGADNDELLLHFRGIAELPYSPENFEKVRTICLSKSKQYRYAKVYHTYDDEAHSLTLHIGVETIHPTEEAFMHYMYLCFQLANEIWESLNSRTGLSDEEVIDRRRDERMLIDAEMAHETKRHKERKPNAGAPNHGTLSEYLSYLFNGEKLEDLLSLRIQSANGVEEIRQRDKIANFDILDSVICETKEGMQFASYEPVVLTVEAVANNYIFTLHPIKAQKEYLTVRMTAVCAPHEYLQDYVPEATYEPQAISMLLCYVISELPETDEAMEELPTTNYTKQVKHGHLLMQHKAYLQAIAVLTPINEELKSRFFQLSDKEKELYFSTCYFLGFSYQDLRQYEKAHYYLEIAHNCNRFDYSQEYINSLANGRDIRIFSVLHDEEEAIGKQIRDIDKSDDCGTEKMQEHRDQLIDYMAFLRRRRGYAQINFGYLDDAKETFESLLNHEGSREYAEHELEYIESLKKKNKS